ncbi:MAG: hypothetical protein M3155_00945 [Actinomycetota bacterium]|nr:hypothetical protein [Actinomycetota bacterium]
MSILTALRDRQPRGATTDGFDASAAAEPDLPMPGYDRLKVSRITASLPRHSQTELTAIEAYERAHDARPEVLNKLRYLRGSEPIPGYDGLTPEEIADALRDADLHTITDAREYERKFHRRQPVLDDLTRLRRRHA